MNPLLMFFQVMLVPFGVALILLVPLHLALLLACYLIYVQTGQEAAVLAHRFDPFFMIENYHQLFTYWQAHIAELPFFTHTLPIIGIPLLTLLIAAWCCYRFLIFMKEHLGG